MWEYCLSVIVTVMFVSACVPLFSEDNTRTKIQEYLLRKSQCDIF